MKWLKVSAVIFGAVVITALGIDAADTLTGNDGTMLGQLIGGEGGVCPRGMVEVPQALSFTCVDKYEASPAEACPVKNPNNELESKQNVDNRECGAVSVVGVNPWRNINREQAMIACVRAGKRLPDTKEWYQAALGTVDDADACNIDSNNALPAGENNKCQSAVGAEDMIGNVWEWVSDDVSDGSWQDKTLPKEGYVVQVDESGMAVETSNTPDSMFNEDYFWTNESGTYGILRGGFYGSEKDAGVYSVQAKTKPTTAGTAIGFRCVK